MREINKDFIILNIYLLKSAFSIISTNICETAFVGSRIRRHVSES